MMRSSLVISADSVEPGGAKSSLSMSVSAMSVVDDCAMFLENTILRRDFGRDGLAREDATRLRYSFPTKIKLADVERKFAEPARQL